MKENDGKNNNNNEKSDVLSKGIMKVTLTLELFCNKNRDVLFLHVFLFALCVRLFVSVYVILFSFFRVLVRIGHNNKPDYVMWILSQFFFRHDHSIIIFIVIVYIMYSVCCRRGFYVMRNTKIPFSICFCDVCVQFLVFLRAIRTLSIVVFGFDQIYCAISSASLFHMGEWFFFDKMKIKNKSKHTQRTMKSKQNYKKKTAKCVRFAFLFRFFFFHFANSSTYYLLCVNGFELIIIVSVCRLLHALIFVFNVIMRNLRFILKCDLF